MPTHERPDGLPAGQIPEVARVVVGDDLFGAAEPGQMGGIGVRAGHDGQPRAVECGQIGGDAVAAEQERIVEGSEDGIVGEVA